MRILRSRYLELPEELRAQLDAAAHAEFEQYAIVRETEWATPDWTFMAMDGDSVAAYHNIIERTVSIDGVAVRVAGLNNVVTMPAQRRRGFASSLLRETQPRWFDELGAECGLLLCADPLLPFYSRLGWQKVSGPVEYSQPGGTRKWTENCMLLDPPGRLKLDRVVDLRGLPW